MNDAQETALADQFRAAADEARAYAHTQAHAPGATNFAMVDRPPLWLEAFLDEHLALITAGKGRGCPHIGQTPMVLHVGVWQPGVVACTRCAESGLIDELATFEQAVTCAVCGKTGTLDTLTGGHCQGGHLVVHFTIHKACDWSQQ